MKRRDFIRKTGETITATMFMVHLGRLGNHDNQNKFQKLWNEDANKRPSLDDLPTPILKSIGIGVNAPSPHNTQSWKFKIINDKEMLLYVDENRLLPSTDPTMRQIHIGAGCFIETLSIGISSLGLKAHVDYFPEGYGSTQDFGKKPVAHILLEKSNDGKQEWADFILQRQTSRRAYDGDIISDLEFADLVKKIGDTHARFDFVNRLDDMKPLSDLLYKSFEIETLNYKTSEETRKMFRFSEKESAIKRDGLSIPQMGYKGLIKDIAEKSLKNGDEKAWHSDQSNNSVLKNFRKGLDTAKGFVLLKTDNNDLIDWVKTGRDFVQFSLASTQAGFYMHPCTQSTQEYDEMKEQLRLLNDMRQIRGSEKIQMIARIGRSSKPYYSYRRNVKDYLMG